MSSRSKLLVLTIWFLSSCEALKMGPVHQLLRSPAQKRQQTADSSAPQYTTVTTNFGNPSGRPNTCVCKLVSAYTPFVTITSTYTATSSNDGVSTTTLAQQSGSVPGTVEIITPVSFTTTTTFYQATGSDAGATTTITIAQPSGTVPGTVLVEEPASYTVITTYADISATTTFTSSTYTGGSNPGTIVVEYPATYTTITNYNLASGSPVTTYTISTYTGGSVPGTVEIDNTGIYTTSTTFWGQSSTVTSTSITYTGPSGTSTQTGLVIVKLPASNAPVATSPTVSVLSQYTAPASTESPTLPANPTPSSTASAMAAPTSCNNQGLEWAEYDNISGDWSRPGPNNDPPGYASFAVEPYKMMQPNYEGVTSNIAGFNYTPTDQGSITIYNTATVPSDYWTLNHQGYIFAPQTGVYNFTSYVADDIVLVWVGPIAYTGWSRSNAGLEQVYNDPPQGYSGYPGEPPVSFTVNLEQGQYYPFRILYANAQNQAQFHIYIIAPDGTEFLGPDTAGSPYIVQYSCDLTTAPRFPAFGDQS